MEPNQPNEVGIFRILDANLNRAAEGMRVVEEYARFVLDDAHLTRGWKELRHELVAACAKIDSFSLLAARDASRDVGTTVAAADEYVREDAECVAAASQKRVEQALRCLEEYAKPLGPAVGEPLEQLRYRAYSLSRAMQLTRRSRARLESHRLYVLIDGGASKEACLARVELLLAAGVRLFQFRDKQLNDAEVVERAREVRGLTRAAEALLIINDRPDIACVVDADGVHVGQEELAVHDARAVVGIDRLVGVSTHSLEQAQRAVLDGANYIGCGPTFPSQTKEFSEFPGLDFLRQVSAEIRLPAFAIGGIQLANLDEVIGAGFSQVAVSSGVCAVDDPAIAAGEFLERLQLPASGGCQLATPAEHPAPRT